jgi:putative tricarboxylic transport membrane protein
VAFAAALAVPAFAQDYTIMAPANPGGGWDGTARAMQEVLQAEGIAPSVEVVNVPGAGGTVGLAQFVADSAGDPTKLIVGGYVMVGAILTNASPVTLKDVTPIARLTGDMRPSWCRRRPTSRRWPTWSSQAEGRSGRRVSWAGGSAGRHRPHHRPASGQGGGVDPTKINYVAFSGGGEAMAAILGNQVTVGVSSVGEFQEQVKAGTMRLLAVSSAERICRASTRRRSRKAGFDVVVQNWRMVAAARA